RILRGKLELRFERADLRDLVRRALEVCKPEIHARHMQITFSPPSEPAWIKADPVRVQQVFWNLLRNAVKFSPAGGTIRVDLAAGPEEFRVRVIDEGVGIEAAVLPQVFTPFEQ